MITPIIDEPKTAVAASYSPPQRRGRPLDPLAGPLLAAVIGGPGGRPAATSSPPRRRVRLLDPLAVALLAAVIGGAGASRPSLWFDESATISASASRSLPDLWRVLGHIDAVHG